MWERIREITGKFFKSLIDPLTEGQIDDLNAEGARELAQVLRDAEGIEQKDSEDAAIGYMEVVMLGAGVASPVARQRAVKAGTKAFSRAASKAELDLVAKKLFAKVSELQKTLPKIAVTASRSKLGAWFAALFKKPTNVVLLFFAATQLDVFAWGPKMISEGLRSWGFGDFFDSLQYKRVGSTITSAQAEDITKSYHREGLTDLFDLDTNDRLDLTPANVLYLYERIRQDEVAAGKVPEREGVLKRLRSRAGKGGAPSPAATGAAAQKAFQQIKIEGLPLGQILVPPVVVERITNKEELKSVIRKSVAEFINQIDDRLSFEIQLTRFWVDPGGMVITPNPPAYLEREKRGDTEITRTVQNKIVVLNTYFTTHENKRVKIFAWPLDYSVADTVLTPAPEGLTEPLPVIVDVVKQILTPPVAEAAAPAAASAPPAPPTIAPQPAAPSAAAVFGVAPVSGAAPGGYTKAPLRGVSGFPIVFTVQTDGLAVRSGPTSGFPLAGSQRLFKGNEFKGVDAVLGEAVDGYNVWIVSEFGNYVWGGGVSPRV